MVITRPMAMKMDPQMISDFPRRPPPNDPRDLRLPDRRVLIMSDNYATMSPIMRPNHGECAM
jgi:hypothetical protein